MPYYPHNPNLGQTQQTDAPGVNTAQAWLRHLHLSAAEAATGSTTAVHAAVQDDGEGAQVVTTAITNPPYPRNITATSGGTAGDIGDGQVIVEGTNAAGEAITETLPAFTENSATTVAGAKAFATVTEITVPAHDGTGATTAIGFGDILGLPDFLTHNTLVFAFHNNAREGTPPTMVADADELEKNTADLNTALNGSVVDLYYIV